MSKSKVEKREEQYPEYPSTSPSKDVYNKAKETHLNSDGSDVTDDDTKTNDSAMLPEEELSDKFVAEVKEDNDWNEENFDETHTGRDLDVPGSDLDDEYKNIGNKDEENNYFSFPDQGDK